MVWYGIIMCMCAGCVCVVQEVKFEKAVVGGDRWYVKGSSGREGRDVGQKERLSTSQARLEET